jgi:hypothetical protein
LERSKLFLRKFPANISTALTFTFSTANVQQVQLFSSQGIGNGTIRWIDVDILDAWFFSYRNLADTPFCYLQHQGQSRGDPAKN